MSSALNRLCFRTAPYYSSLSYLLLQGLPQKMLLRTCSAVCLKNAPPCLGSFRFISRSAARCEDSKIDDSGRATATQKVVYPRRKLKPKVMLHPMIHGENPFQRSFRSLKHDYDLAKSIIQNKPPPPFMSSTDVLIIGGGLLGSSIAHHLLQSTGPGLNVTLVEKNPPELSSSLKVLNNNLHQQLRIKPCLEMAQYAVDYYRKLNLTFSDPDLPPIDVEFFPNNSLQLANDSEADTLSDLSELYREMGWRHQMLSPAMLRRKFPWLNVEGVSAGCLGLQREGVINKLKAVAAMRSWAKKDKVNITQGEVIGFEFVDQTDFYSPQMALKHFYSPRRAVIQTPSGDIIKRQFGYLIIAAGTSVNDLLDMLNVDGELLKLPIQSQKCSKYEISCPQGPGIEMPMIMESNGMKFRKSDILSSYVVWDDTSCEGNNTEDDLKADESLFREKLFPQLTNRVPSFKDSKLISSQAGLTAKSVWDDNIFVGPIPSLYNVVLAAGLGNDEFLYAPAAGRGVADIILEREFSSIDLNCFRLERIEKKIKLNKVSYDLLYNN